MDKKMEKIIQIAAQVLKLSAEDASLHCKQIPDTDAWYFWNPVRGGGAVIINEAGEKLGATSSVSYERHLQAFTDGKRN